MNKNDVMIHYTDERSIATFEAIANLYESVGFGTVEFYKGDKGFEIALASSASTNFFALDEQGDVVGMTRVFSDNKICTWIAELCVHPEWQGNGIGRNLVQMVISRFGHTAIYVEAFSGSEGFFTRQGIKPKTKLVACSRAGQRSESSSEPVPFSH
ncbi:GNAT family N-acetyltransferase [Herbaspirillum huttiense]|uniref:GNAT family N-acetyltransferase n=2 Tax=Herbaspirillum huttiense TaxID=863372 RepID=A0AAJ2HIA1_9BURK|nr:GNAT family N-acetyltransferase [Herbaspirillum huttiense]MDR9839175.1 GNAT family N-acetyltransferase [Herbaspirillum huttiense]